jgi:hypothetical protein
MSLRRKVSFKKKLSIPDVSNSLEMRLTEKGEKGFSFMQKSAGVMEHCKISNSKHQISWFQVSGVRCQEQET